MTDNFKFKISSGLKSVIGKDLITDKFIAIFELVKNSYDAGAKNVTVVFQGIKKGEKKILIIDDGSGMSLKELEDNFLFVGYSKKKEKPSDFRDKIEKRKFFAGAKGVGRFSCDKLGRKLRVYTKKDSGDSGQTLIIDWAKFDKDQKKEFQTIKVEHYSGDGVNRKIAKGTILEITDLNETWDKDDLLKLKKHLQRLINPTQINQDFNIILEAEEFKDHDIKSKKQKWNVINGKIDNTVFEKLEIKTTEINSFIDEEGKSIITELYDKGQFIFKLKEKNIYNKLKNTRVKLFYLNREAKKAFTDAMGLRPIEYGSIFFYKNGIRIQPYGEEGDDWLELEVRKGQGYARYLSTRELIGRFELSGPQEGFIEVSSRAGGVIKNESYSDLVDFFRTKVLRKLERYVAEAIDWDKKEVKEEKDRDEIKIDSIEFIKKIAGSSKAEILKFNKNLLKIAEKKETEKLPELIKNVEKLTEYVKSKEQKDYLKTQLKSFRRVTSNLKRDKKNIEKELEVEKKESLFSSKVISTDKDVIINLNHTIENSTLVIEYIIGEINKKIKENAPIQTIAKMVDGIDIENKKIKVLAGFVSQANFNMKVESIENDIITYIKEYLEKIKHRMMSFNFSNSNLEFVTRFKPLEISIVLDNLISNAKKAKANKLLVEFKIENRELHIFFSDNGKGINEDDARYIFKRGYTTTDGSGIGLAHIKKILESRKGTIKFRRDNHVTKGARFEVILKK